MRNCPSPTLNHRSLPESGLEALERLAGFNADVIVTDLITTRMDGFELLRHLKERGDQTPGDCAHRFRRSGKGALRELHDLKAFWFPQSRWNRARSGRRSGTRHSLQKKSSENRGSRARPEPSRRTRRRDQEMSPAMQQIFSLIRQVAPNVGPRIDPGRGGTGKEFGGAGDPPSTAAAAMACGDQRGRVTGDPD